MIVPNRHRNPFKLFTRLPSNSNLSTSRFHNSEEQYTDCSSTTSMSVFISHGHVELLKYQLKDFVKTRLGGEPLILSEQPNNGMTIVEKLESASEKCNKAIILLTKDDEMANGNKRGRQNVIHEIGFFQGKYGRKNVILLCEEGVELFTNISGIVSIQFDRKHFPEVFEQLREELHSGI